MPLLLSSIAPPGRIGSHHSIQPTFHSSSPTALSRPLTPCPTIERSSPCPLHSFTNLPYPSMASQPMRDPRASSPSSLRPTDESIRNEGEEAHQDLVGLGSQYADPASSLSTTAAAAAAIGRSSLAGTDHSASSPSAFIFSVADFAADADAAAAAAAAPPTAAIAPAAPDACAPGTDSVVPSGQVYAASQHGDGHKPASSEVVSWRRMMSGNEFRGELCTSLS